MPTPSIDLLPRLSAAIQSGAPPDVVRLDESDVQICRAKGHMMDVTDLVEKMRRQQGGLFDPCLRAIGYEERYWGVPFAINPWPMHARLDVLERNGLDYPRTWEAFVETCKKIGKPPFYGFGMDLGRTVNAAENIMQLCWCFGGCIYDAEGNPAFDDESNVRGFAFIDEMYNKHKIIPEAVVDNRDDDWNNEAYQAGQVAFIANPTSVFAYLSTENPELTAKTGLFPLPAGPAGSVNQIDTWSLALLAQSPYPELAKGLAEYFMAPERYNEVIVANNGRFVPVYPNLLNDPWWSERPETAAFVEIASTGVPISYEAPPSAASAEVLATHIIPEALQKVLINGVDPAEAVARAHQKILAISERYAKQRG